MSEVVELKVICKAVKLAPKVARARLRNAKRGDLPKSVGYRWAWRPKDAVKVKRYLAA